MASTEDVVDTSPLKVPVIDVNDLLSDDESNDASHENLGETRDTKKHDNAVQEDEDSDGGHWESESFYEDALEGIGDEHLGLDGKQYNYTECFYSN